MDSPTHAYHLQVVYWVETKGKTLEEIDALFEGEKHSQVPDVAAVQRGQATVTAESVAKQGDA